MNLSHPEFDVFGENEGRVLYTLSTLVDGASGRRIHALSGVKSLITTRQVLARLVLAGLVGVRRVGAANLFTANRNHILWESVTLILDGPARLESSITDLLAESKLEGLIGAALYGSFARREAGRDSDIDILVVHEEGALRALVDPIGAVSAMIEEMSGNVVQMLPVTIVELRAMIVNEDPLIGSLRRDARDLTEGFDLAGLLALLTEAVRG